jgi:hypothetical protein
MQIFPEQDPHRLSGPFVLGESSHHQTHMPQNLSKKDHEIPAKLAPDLTDELCPGSGHPFF